MAEQDKTVADYLAAQGVTFAAVLTGETKRDDWTCDGWRVRFEKRAQSGGKVGELATEYFTGNGHRQPLKRAPKAPANQRSIAYEQWAREWLKPTAPTAASVLYSLLADAAGAEQPFDYWAADYGYDTDSIKALNTYNACCEIRRQVNAFFNQEEREQMRAMLEDY